LKVFITKYYKKLFGASEPNHFTLVEEINDDIPQLSLEESTLLTADFTEEEVKVTITQMEKNNATGLDGLPMELYQNIWEVIKLDLMAMFVQLQTGK
jgi:hypothetical protein